MKHPKILQKAIDELKFCDEEGHAPVEVLKDCLVELEARGFVSLTGPSRYAVQIRDQKQKLHVFISNLLQSGGGGSGGIPFEHIYKGVCHEYDNFYTKEFVFKVIDELFQMGLIYETGKCCYAFLVNY